MRICASINLRGRSLEAMRFYGGIFHATPEYMTWSDMPPSPCFPVSDALKPMVMHGELFLDKEQSLMFVDDPREGEGVLGNAISLTILFDEEDELRRVYAALADGGEPQMPPAPTFWSACFAMVKDRFGLAWSLNLCKLPEGKKFMAAVVEYPAKRLIGMKVRTSMQRAQIDCPALWQTFGPRMSELLPAGGGIGSHGVSVMINAEEFDYWAAIEAGPSAKVPPGMDSIDIPAGLYAKCPVPNLENLGGAYMYMYTEWPKSQTMHALNEQVPCFELYPPHWDIHDTFDIFVPIRKA